jgi:alpha-1,6-mannosyltransferase
MRIVHIANFYGPKSGGLRTTMHQLGLGYQEAGFEFIYIVPDETSYVETTPYGKKIAIKAPLIPFSGGYRAIINPVEIIVILENLKPDRIEVSDRLTLRRVGLWAKRKGIFSVVFSHETLDGLTKRYLNYMPFRKKLVDWHNRRLSRSFNRVIATTEFASKEFQRIDCKNLERIPLGVDLTQFSTRYYNPKLRDNLAKGAEVLLIHVGRLSPEKNPMLSIATLRILLRSKVNARLVVVGSGPLKEKMMSAAKNLPVEFFGFVSDRKQLAQLIAVSDVSLAPGPLETFCLSALESLAAGTQVVCSITSAVPEIIGEAGASARNYSESFAVAVQKILERGDKFERSTIARKQAEKFSWWNTTQRMLRIHGIEVLEDEFAA